MSKQINIEKEKKDKILDKQINCMYKLFQILRIIFEKKVYLEFIYIDVRMLDIKKLNFI